MKKELPSQFSIPSGLHRLEIDVLDDFLKILSEETRNAQVNLLLFVHKCMDYVKSDERDSFNDPINVLVPHTRVAFVLPRIGSPGIYISMIFRDDVGSKIFTEAVEKLPVTIIRGLFYPWKSRRPS